ncbi:MAG: DUF4249 family protein [Bacteroidales bacterium]
MDKRVLVWVLVIFSACNKEQVDSASFVNTNAITHQYELVIEGMLSDETAVQMVQLSKPIYVTDTVKHSAIHNAEVYVTDGENIYQYMYSDQKGLYYSKKPYRGVPDKEYTIHVVYNNKQYTATDCMPECDSTLNYPVKDIRKTGSRIEIYSKTHNFGYSTPSIWTGIERSIDASESFPHIDINYANRFIFLYNHSESPPQGVFPSGFTSTGVSGHENDTLQIVKMAISDSYYDYLISYFNSTDWSSSIFATIPGNTCTNVSKGATGYFHTAAIQRFTLTYKDFQKIVSN